MIKTKEYQLTPKELFAVSFRYALKKTLIAYGLLFIIFQGIVFSMLDFSTQKYFDSIWLYLFYGFAYFGVITAITSFVRYRNLYSPKNKIYFRPIYYEIDEKFIKGVRDSGSSGSFSWDDVFSCKKMKDRYLMLVSKNAAIHLPFTIFKSQKDLQKFEEILRSKKLS